MSQANIADGPKVRTRRPRNFARGPGERSDSGPRLVVPFVGRVEPLSLFIDALNEDPRSAARVVNVSGVSGSGRSRFVEEALARLGRMGRPNFIVQPELAPGTTGAALVRGIAAKLPVGGTMCSATVTSLERAGSQSLDEATARALVNALFHESYDCGIERRGFVRPKPQRLVIVFDNFDMLAPSAIGWIGNHLLTCLHEVRLHLDYALILITERSLAGDMDPVAWNALPARFLSIDLQPMTEAESIDLLAFFARRSAEAKICHEIGEGMPGQMLELLKHRLRPLTEISAGLERCNGPMAEVLAAIAALGIATEEGLRLALGAEAIAGASSLAQNAPVPVFGGLRAGGFWLAGRLSGTVLDKLNVRMPDVVRRAREAADLLDALSARFGSEEERRTAVRLRAFRFFNRDALVACFGASEGATLEQFARAHPEGFIETQAGNLRFADGVTELIDRYRKGIGDTGNALLQDKATKYWAERSQEMKRQLSVATEQQKVRERERDELFAQLEKARSQVSERAKEGHSEWKNRLDDDVVWLGVSLLANGAGVVCFWVALFSASQRLSFIVLGAVLIGIGFGTPALSRRPSSAARASAAHSARRQHLDQARNTVRLLEAQTSGLQQRLTEERRRVEKLRLALEEPLVD